MSTTSCSSCDTEPASVGWVYESSGRGTLTLINTRLFTIFLCNWVVIHPRVYKRRLFTALYKISLFIKAVLAPELIAVEGLQERTQCRKMKRDCARIVGDEFKLIHAFYISMLALRYQTPRGDKGDLAESIHLAASATPDRLARPRKLGPQRTGHSG